MHDLLRDVRYAARRLVRTPMFTIATVITLALGIGANTAIFTLVNGVLLRPLPFPEPDRLVGLWQTAPGVNIKDLNASRADYITYREDARTLADVAIFQGSAVTVTGQGEPERVETLVATFRLLPLLGVQPILGRAFTERDNDSRNPDVVMLGHGYWQRRFGGDPSVVGRRITIDGTAREVIGVLPRGFWFMDGPSDMLQPLRYNRSDVRLAGYNFRAVGRMKPGVTVAQVNADVARMIRLQQGKFPPPEGMSLKQFEDARLGPNVRPLIDDLVGDVKPALWMLFGAVIMVLLIACANVANLVLVRGASRQGEIAVRTALGAGRGRLVQFLLIESAVIAAAGAALGLFLAGWGVDVLKQLAPDNIPRLAEVGFSTTTFLFALATASVTAVLFGLGPALQILRTPLGSLLNVRSETGSRRTRWSRSALLVAEVGLSLMLLVGAGLLLRSMYRLQAIDPGFKADNITIFTIGLPGARYPKPPDVVRAFTDLDDRLSALPGVEIVGRINGIPLGPGENVLSFTRTDRPDPGPGQVPNALYRTVDDDYFRAAGIPLVAGRFFDSRDGAEGQPTIIISKEMADEFWRGEDPIGKTISLERGTVKTIVGVVAGVRSSNIEQPPQPEMYVPLVQTQSRSATYLIRSPQPEGQVLSAAREAVRAMDPRLPLIQPGTFKALEDAALARPRFYLLLLTLFAVLAVALAAIGIYGVVAYVVSQRTREIGVRIALGARTGSVIRLVVWQGLRPALLGVVLGIVGAIQFRQLISGLLYEIEPLDPPTIALVIVLLSGIVLLACLVPARRAAKIPPASALRSE